MIHRCPLATLASTLLFVLSLAAPAVADCKVSHEILDGGATLRVRADGCSLSLPETSAAIEALLDEAWGGKRMPVERVSLGLGRIVEHAWLSKGLADAATKSPIWDGDKGRGRRGSDNAAVASLVDARRLLTPLAPVFARYGAKARAASVEKVLVGKVGDTKELASFVGQPLAEGKKLPYDAQLWMRLERMPEP